MVFSDWQEKPDQWTVTDDLAEIGEDGTLTLLGRADSIVKVGGKRFSAGSAAKASDTVEIAIPKITVSSTLCNRIVQSFRVNQKLLCNI